MESGGALGWGGREFGVEGDEGDEEEGERCGLLAGMGVWKGGKFTGWRASAA